MPATPEERTRFGARLRELRGRRSLREVEVLLRGQGVEVSTAQLSGWETGKYAPRYRQTTEALDRVLGAGGELVEMLYGPVASPRRETTPMTTEELVVVVRELAEVVRELREDLNAARRRDS